MTNGHFWRPLFPYWILYTCTLGLCVQKSTQPSVGSIQSHWPSFCLKERDCPAVTSFKTHVVGDLKSRYSLMEQDLFNRNCSLFEPQFRRGGIKSDENETHNTGIYSQISFNFYCLIHGNTSCTQKHFVYGKRLLFSVNIEPPSYK